MLKKKTIPPTRGRGSDVATNPLGLIALQGVQLADRTFTEARNGFTSYLRSALLGADELPLSNLIFPVKPGTGYVAVYGAATVNDSDLLTNIQMEMPAAQAAQLPPEVSLMGYMITERYQNFTGGRAHTCSIRGYYSNYNEATAFRRDVTVMPTEDVNGVCEYIILNMRPSFTLGYPGNNTISGQLVQSVTSMTRDPKGYLQPWTLKTLSTGTTNNAFSSVLVLLQGLAAGQTVNATVTPLFRTVDCIKTLAEILEIPFERL